MPTVMAHVMSSSVAATFGFAFLKGTSSPLVTKREARTPAFLLVFQRVQPETTPNKPEYLVHNREARAGVLVGI